MGVAQGLDMLSRFREEQTGRQLSLQRILSVLDPTTLDATDDTEGVPDGKKLKLQDFLLTVDGLSTEQATDIMARAIEGELATEKESSLSISDATLKILEM